MPRIYRPSPTGKVVVEYRGQAYVIDPKEQIQDSQTLNRLAALVCYLLVTGVFVAGGAQLPAIEDIDMAARALMLEHRAHELTPMVYMLYPEAETRPIVVSNAMVNWPFHGWLANYDPSQHGVVHFGH